VLDQNDPKNSVMYYYYVAQYPAPVSKGSNSTNARDAVRDGSAKELPPNDTLASGTIATGFTLDTKSLCGTVNMNVIFCPLKTDAQPGGADNKSIVCASTKVAN
jgi:hypothetical protein